MELSDFANKRSAIYGLGFHGDNIKVFGDIKYPLDIATIEGYNLLNQEKWGKYFVQYTFDGPVISYNLPNNHWHKQYFPNIRKLVDKNLRTVKVKNLPDCVRPAITNRLSNMNSKIDEQSGLGIVTVHIPDVEVIEGTAYWWKIRLGKFYMVELANEI